MLIPIKVLYPVVEVTVNEIYIAAQDLILCPIHFHFLCSNIINYALINRSLGPCKEIFVLLFKAHGLNAVRSMQLECQNKYFPYGPKCQLIRALLYTYTNKIPYNDIY